MHLQAIAVDQDLSDQTCFPVRDNALLLALRGMRIGTWRFDPLGRTVDWDEVTGSLIGTGPVRNLPLELVPLHPADAGAVEASLDACSARSLAHDIEFRIIRPDGSLRWLHVFGLRHSCEPPGRHCTTGIITDITTRKLAERGLQEIEERYRLAGRATRDLVWDWELQSDRLSWNETLGTRFGFEHSLLGDRGKWKMRRIHVGDRARVAARLEAMLAGGDSEVALEYQFRCADGTYAQVLDRAYLIRDENGQALRMVGAMQDLTEFRAAEANLRRSEAVNQSILAASADCIKIIGLDGRIELMNEPGLLAMDLETELQVKGRRWIHLWPREARETVAQALESARGGKPFRFSGFCPTAKGAPKWWDVVVTPMSNGEGEVSRLLSISRDITSLRKTAEQLRWSSDHDSLTLLPNRGAFEARLQAKVLEAMASGRSIGLLLIDFDHFKHVNDTLGHQAGDFLLKAFAERLIETVGGSDFVGRLGGDEFAVLIENAEVDEDLVRTGSAILLRVQKPVPYGGRVLNIRASIGGALFPRDAQSAHELFRNADTALFALKAEGRGGTKVFQGYMLKQMQETASQIGLAHAAVTENRIRPHYQPKVDLRSGQILGFEALLRLDNRASGYGAPATIAEAFKDYELASQIGERMQVAVFSDVVDWFRLGLAPGRVSINAAPAEFLRDDFSERLLERIALYGVAPQALEIEVTEQVFVERGVDYVSRALHKLHAAGISIALDDFGTGYSSLSHLRDFPVDVVKVDRSFVQKVVGRREIAAIVRSVASLCSNLGLDVVAEGVETPEQARSLIAHGCLIGQGFLFGRPVPAGKVPDLLATHRLLANAE